MTRDLVLGVALVGLLAALPPPAARAGIDVGVGNGDKIQGTLDPADSMEEYRVRVPKDAVISISVKGQKAKGKGAGPAPAMNFDLVGPDENLIDTGEPRGTGAKLKWTALVSGEYTVLVYGDGQNVGNYKASIKWKSRRKVPIAGDLTQADPTLTVPFDADAKAAIGLLVKASRKSAARPRLSTLNGMDIDPPDKATSKSHKVKRYAEALGFGNATLVITNAGADGAVTGKVTVKPPKVKKRKVRLTDKDIQPLGASQSATGEVLDADGGLVEVVGGEFGDIEGSSVDVPPGALAKPTAIVIATAPEFAPSDDEIEGTGPSTLFGPEGQRFAQPVEVTVVFDPTPFAGDPTFDTMRVFTQDSRGKVTEITDFTVNATNKTVSFFVNHFSRFRIFGPRGPAKSPGLVRPDLDGDGTPDFIAPGPGANTRSGQVFYDLGANFAPGDNQLNVINRIGGDNAGDEFGAPLLVRDVTRDGTADLIVGDGAGFGNVYIFFGRTGFSPTSPNSADVEFSGTSTADGFGGAVAVGNVNFDGHLDLIVGAESGTNAAGEAVGTAYVFFGPFSGSKTSDEADVKFTGELTDDLFGASVASGDVTGDRVHDVIVSADMIDRAGAPGRVYVFEGGRNISDTLARNADILITGENGGDGFGLPVTVGPVNDDSVLDIVVGQGTDSGGATASAVYVFHGGTGLDTRSASAADVKITGDTQGDNFGTGIFVQDIGGAAGGEIIVWAPNATVGSLADAGRGYVFSGGSLTSGSASARVSTIIEGVVASGEFGHVLPGVPYDAALGLYFYAPLADFGQFNGGRGYVFDALPAGTADADTAPRTVSGSQDDMVGSDGD